LKSENISYLPAVDHLRAFAATLVIYFHSVTFVGNIAIAGTDQKRLIASNVFEALVIEGHTGVALFMVLSGFIFTFGCYGTDIRYGRFIKNRFLRTYPLYLFLLLLGVSAYPLDFNLEKFIQGLLPLANIGLDKLAGEFGTLFWAVAVEWQFYLVFPFILAMVNRNGWTYLVLLIVAFIMFRNIAYTMDPHVNMVKLSYQTIAGRMDQFLVGMIIAIIYRHHFEQNWRWDCLFLIFAPAVLFVLYQFNILYGWHLDHYSKVWWPTIEAIVWGGFILGYLSVSRFVPKILGKLLVAVGTITYSMYLCHFMVLMMIMRLGLFPVFEGYSWMLTGVLATTLVVMPAVLVISTISYWAIERPFLSYRGNYKYSDI
jgi:peptidoglycan/LPS O-acetylase OafA/YrhL